jgi:nitrate reductase NapAB chaperone NapD
MDDNTFRKVHFLTVAHDYEPTKSWEHIKRLDTGEVSLKDLIDSCKKMEISLVVHGRGKSFDSTIFKLENILEYCIHNTSDSDIVVYLDAFDTAILANQTEILEKFEVFDKKIVFFSHYVCEPY